MGLGPHLTGDANVGRFQYTGQAWIEEVELYYDKARLYPALGRFMQTDPIGYNDGMTASLVFRFVTRRTGEC